MRRLAALAALSLTAGCQPQVDADLVTACRVAFERTMPAGARLLSFELRRNASNELVLANALTDIAPLVVSCEIDERRAVRRVSARS